MLLYTWIPFPFSPICSIHHIPEGLISLFQVSQLDHVFALSDLEDETFATLIRVLRLYGECQLKGQKTRKSDLRKGTFHDVELLDCPTSKIRCLRGDLRDEEVLHLLKSVETCEASFSEMQKEAGKMKELREVKKYIIKETCCKTWEEAQHR